MAGALGFEFEEAASGASAASEELAKNDATRRSSESMLREDVDAPTRDDRRGGEVVEAWDGDVFQITDSQ